MSPSATCPAALRPSSEVRFLYRGGGRSMGFEQFRYDGKRVVVVGGATGMGAAAAQTVRDAGAEVIVMDVADVTFPVDGFVNVDLRDRASVDKAADQLDGPVAAVFSCAGVADGTPGLILINFISHRHLIERLV